MTAQQASADPFPKLVMYFQPQYSADGKTIVSVEALLRQRDAEKGVISPGSFLEKLSPEEADAVDWWVLRRSFEESRRFPTISLGVNVPAGQFRDARFAPRVLALIAEVGADPRHLELEIVEGAYIENFDAALTNINSLRAAGVRIAIDDFGTGYSSLTYLLKLPVDKLKIDQSFVAGVGYVQSAAIIHAVVALARALGLKITAEGVETTQQHQFLRIAGCHYMQGWLFSKAVSAETLIDMLDHQDKARQAG